MVAGGNSTQDQTLRRKSTVTGGVTANPASGFPTLGTEWDALGTNVISNLGTHGIGSTVTLTATGDGGVQTSCLAVVTVVDNTPPEVSCQDITVELPADGSFELSTAFILAEVPTSFTDNCQTSTNIGVGAPGLVAYTCSEIGTFPATFGFKDLAGNNTDCTINVTVVDNLAPTAACKAASVQLNASGMASIAPADVFDATNSSDNCGAVNPQSVSPASFTCADLGSNMVTLTVNDNHGNTATCMATVTVADDVYSCNQAPTAACQPVTVDANPNCQGAAAPTDFDGGSTDPEMGILSFGVSPVPACIRLA
ncbi:MAG: hypothetical protein H6560_00215 [Lewinellaceae bacterium]|nr:hypothetical protein [Lewinellaceae bacterium]